MERERERERDRGAGSLRGPRRRGNSLAGWPKGRRTLGGGEQPAATPEEERGCKSQRKHYLGYFSLTSRSQFPSASSSCFSSRRGFHVRAIFFQIRRQEPDKKLFIKLLDNTLSRNFIPDVDWTLRESSDVSQSFDLSFYRMEIKVCS